MTDLIQKQELDDLIWRLLRGFPEGFEICSIIQKGVSYPKAIPKSFWFDEDKAYDGIFGLSHLSKSAMKKVHTLVIERIVQEINEPHHVREMFADNYSRLFHALTILKVNKNNLRVPVIGNNYMYNIAYYLWALDDGQPHTYEFIRNVAWYAAECFKTNKLTSDRLVTGIRPIFP